MKVIMGDSIHDSNEEPIVLIFTLKDRQNISNMAMSATSFFTYPDTMEWKDVVKWADRILKDSVDSTIDID